jgi:Protein of unknown function (DUF1264)
LIWEDVAFLEVDKGHELPLGHPKLMGSLTDYHRRIWTRCCRIKNRRGDVDRKDQARKREETKEPGIHENADWWWKDKKAGVFTN